MREDFACANKDAIFFICPLLFFLVLVSVIVIQTARHVYEGNIFVVTQNVQYVVKYGMLKWPTAWQDMNTYLWFHYPYAIYLISIVYTLIKHPNLDTCFIKDDIFMHICFQERIFNDEPYIFQLIKHSNIDSFFIY